MGLASLLTSSAGSLGMIAYELHLGLLHSLLGVALFLIPTAGLACLGVAALFVAVAKPEPRHRR